MSHWGDPNDENYLGPDNDILESTNTTTVDTCYFKAFRDTEAEDFPLTIEFFHIWIARLAFIIIFQVHSLKIIKYTQLVMICDANQA